MFVLLITMLQNFDASPWIVFTYHSISAWDYPQKKEMVKLVGLSSSFSKSHVNKVIVGYKTDK